MLRIANPTLSVFFFALLAVTSVDAQEMEFKSASNGGNCDQCGWTIAQGEITPDTPAKLEKLVADGEVSTNYFRIHSSGGDLNAALELGRLFRKYQTTVEVGKSVPRDEIWYQEEDGECLSACAYAFLGGHFRNVPDHGKLGFHQFFDQDIMDNMAQASFTGAERLLDQYVVGVIITYLMEMQINTELYPLIAGTAPGEMRYLEKEDAIRLKVTNIDDPATNWKLLPFGKGLVAEIENPASGRRFRLYCAGNKRHLTYLYRNGTPGEDAKWQPETVLDDFTELFVTNGSKQWPVKHSQFTYDKNKENLIFVFDISADGAEGIAQSSEIKIGTTQNIYRAVSGFFTGLEVKPITGDKRIPKIALRNCI